MGARESLLSFVRADEIASRPTEWLIDGWLVRDTLAGMVGPSGSCKSFVAVDWACRVATGKQWLGCNVKQGAVFFLAGEGRNGLKKRIDGWSKANGVAIKGAPLYIADCLPPLADLANTAAVIDEVSGIAEALIHESGSEPALIVIDTVARAMAGANENSSDDMGRMIQAMDRLRQHWGACVLSLHHTGHGADNQGRARGSSAYYAALDSEFLLKAKGRTVELKCSKGKDWQSPKPLVLTKEEIEIEVPAMCGTTKESTLVLREQAAVSADAERRIGELRRGGMSEREISQHTGIPKSTVHRRVAQAKELRSEFADV